MKATFESAYAATVRIHLVRVSLWDITLSMHYESDSQLWGAGAADGLLSGSVRE